MRNFLIKIHSNPVRSERPAEAVRIAAGVGAWRKVQVHLLLVGAAVRALDEFADELANGDVFKQYLPSIPEHGGKIIVERENPAVEAITPSVTFERMSAEQIAEFASKMDHVMQF